MFYAQGDIVLVPYPFTNLSEDKVRPAVIISNSSINKGKDVILAQITSTVYNDEFTFRLEDHNLTRPLQTHCEIRCSKIFTAEKSIIIKKISSLKPGEYKNLFGLIVDVFK
ncbi:MAG: type II toxin-antitoxin system PemK/MazF family toxin [Bacteroidetes bacterium]|nr:type II toxin-antitoxin system PemK/MazF family toxin [Bacteroidota bacterium]